MDKFYIDVFINDLVKKFRLYNDDFFKIRVEGLTNFIDRENDAFKYLVDLLREINLKLSLQMITRRILIKSLSNAKIRQAKTYMILIIRLQI